MLSFLVLFALAILLTLGTGVWLFLHLTAVAKLFSDKADIVPSPKRPAAPRGRVILMLALFVLGVVGIVTMQIIAMQPDSASIL